MSSRDLSPPICEWGPLFPEGNILFSSGGPLFHRGVCLSPPIFSRRRGIFPNVRAVPPYIMRGPPQEGWSFQTRLPPRVSRNCWVPPSWKKRVWKPWKRLNGKIWEKRKPNPFEHIRRAQSGGTWKGLNPKRGTNPNLGGEP